MFEIMKKYKNAEKHNSVTFVTLAPWIKNVDLCKDVGMIPYYFYKKYGFKSIIVLSKNDDYSYLKSEVNGLQLDFITNKKSNIKFNLNIFLMTIKYLIKKSKSISILNLYHIRIQTAIWAILFKLINPHGKIYLKCDANSNNIIRIQDVFFKKNIINLFKKLLLSILFKKIDLITVETRNAFHKFNKFLKKRNIDHKKCLYLPNGFEIEKYRYHYTPDYIWSMKENIILSVGAFGTEAKNTEILLKSFGELNLKEWKLVLIGPIKQEFNKFIDDYFIKYSSMKDKIIFTGPIYNKTVLYNCYCKSKIFYLPSLWEGFSLALIEAMFFMNYLVVSRLDCTMDVTSNGEYGKLVEGDNLESNIQGLNYAINLPADTLFEMASKVRKKTEEEYNWDKITDKIFSFFHPSAV